MIGALLAASLVCAAPAGADALWDDPQVRFVVVGELHGTVEAPAAFAEIACDASADRPLVVALELSDQMQPSLDQWMASDGGAAAKSAFLDQPFWKEAVIEGDGRSSEAMLAMLERLRDLKAGGRDILVVATQPSVHRPEGFDQSYFEVYMAHAWIRAAYSRPEARVLILVGNMHAMKDRMHPDDHLFAAGHIDKRFVRSLKVAQQGGATWDLSSDGHFGISPQYAAEPADMRGVILQPVRGGLYDGWLALGPATPSPPVKP